ncbi:MAG: NAD-dependent epimerase/dehydratase family protein [Gemmatimonadales bacterium]|nr:NAD-dependent epimerase/dehydratase family protein [Gemmatimonadales bacterium]
MAAFDGASVLVTGGAGFVGGNLVRRLLTDGAGRVHVVDNLLSAERWNVADDPRVSFTEGSISDPAVLWSVADEYDYIFHLSTYHGNQSSMHDPLADHENNLLTTLRLLERIKGFRGLKRVVYSGAGCAVAEKTYDEASATLEDAPISLEMDSPYSISKIVGEFYALYYFNRHQVPVVRARFQNVYGPGEILGAGRWRGTPATVWRNVTPTFIWKALNGEALPLEGGGAASRDFIFVDDIVSGLIACALHGTAGDVYNIASGAETSILELATLINELTGNATPADVKPRRDWDHSGRRFGSPDKARATLGFEAQVPLREGLRRTVAWTREHQPRIETAMRKHAAHMRALGA